VKQHLYNRTIHPKQMAALAPSFLYFVAEMRPYILTLLQGRHLEISDAAADSFSMAAKLMEQEITRRLQSAVSEIEEDFPHNGYRELARRTPWDLIRMFKES